MLNSTPAAPSYLLLLGYLDVGSWRYLYFVIVLLLYVVILLLNASLVVFLSVTRTFRRPMFALLCSLFVNGLYGSTGLFPFLLLHILSDVHTVSVTWCFVQIFALYSYVTVELCTLAIMSCDRYLAVCHPLQYHTRVTLRTVALSVAVTWLYSVLKTLIAVSINVRLTLCENVINYLFCHNYLVVKLACSGTRVNNVYGLFMTVVTVLVPLVPILFSYIKILQVCFSGSKQTRQKAVSTCTPHLVSLINFCFGCCFEIVQSRFGSSHVPHLLRIIMSLYFLVVQPLINPIMFGLQMSKIRTGLCSFMKGWLK